MPRWIDFSSNNFHLSIRDTGKSVEVNDIPHKMYLLIAVYREHGKWRVYSTTVLINQVDWGSVKIVWRGIDELNTEKAALHRREYLKKMLRMRFEKITYQYSIIEEVRQPIPLGKYGVYIDNESNVIHTMPVNPKVEAGLYEDREIQDYKE